MFDEFVKQARRLFSSKTNGGKLVRSTTDRLHYYKQILLAICIVLLIGYSQFRDHFECQGVANIDKKRLTNFCWINGTTTLDLKDEPEKVGSAKRRNHYAPHVGMNFQFNNNNSKYELINHNYMRSLWMLLILMAMCSFLAQSRWSSIFNHETMRALLGLPGQDKLTIVKRAQEIRPYDALMSIPTISNKLSSKRSPELIANMLEGSQLFCSIDILAGDKNDHCHSLDYYPNQLIYLLLVTRTSAYKLSGLSLRRKLIVHSIYSFCLTTMQFLLPYIFIGDKYTLYGLRFCKASFHYVKNQFMATLGIGNRQQVHSLNSIDYTLSSRIWPTLVSCPYQKYGLLGKENITVQCTVSINEICGKLFFVIWWFVAINIVIEFIALLTILACLSNTKILKWSLTRKFWSHSRREAEVIATFRYKMAKQIEKRLERLNSNKELTPLAHNNNNNNLSEQAKKQLEAEKLGETRANHSAKLEHHDILGSKKWYLWCSRDVGLFLGKRFKGTRSEKDSDGFREVKEDLNIYCLLYLLYLRLDHSEKKIEQVIKMTSEALQRYLDRLDDKLDGSQVLVSLEKVTDKSTEEQATTPSTPLNDLV